MEFEGFKSAWQNRQVSPGAIGRQRLTGKPPGFWGLGVGDFERSEERVRLIFTLLFGLVVIAGSYQISILGPGRTVAVLFAIALFIDGIGGIVLLASRYREPATATMLEHVSREHRRLRTKVRFGRYSQAVMFAFAAIALLLGIFGPRPVSFADDIVRIALATTLLAIALRRAKSNSRTVEYARELEGHIRDLQA